MVYRILTQESNSNSNSADCADCKHCCLDSAKCGTQTECQNTSIIIFGTLAGLILILLLILFIYWFKSCRQKKLDRRRRNSRAEFLERQTNEELHQGIYVANAWVTEAPLRQAHLSNTNLNQIYTKSLRCPVNHHSSKDLNLKLRRKKQIERFVRHNSNMSESSEKQLRWLTEEESSSTEMRESQHSSIITLKSPYNIPEKAQPKIGNKGCGEDEYTYGNPFRRGNSVSKTRKLTLTGEFGLDLAEARTRDNTISQGRRPSMNASTLPNTPEYDNIDNSGAAFGEGYQIRSIPSRF